MGGLSGEVIDMKAEGTLTPIFIVDELDSVFGHNELGESMIWFAIWSFSEGWIRMCVWHEKGAE